MPPLIPPREPEVMTLPVRTATLAHETDVLVVGGGPAGIGAALGAAWAGDTADPPPEPADAIIDTTPAWKPVVAALKSLGPGGRLVINAIRKEDADKDELLRIDWAEHLWMEKEIKSVANVARSDLAGCMELAAAAKLRPTVEPFPLQEANRALLELKEGKIRGAKVLKIL